MDLTIAASIHSPYTGEIDGVSFTATVKSGEKTWSYRGTASGTALAVLGGGDREPIEVFDQYRAKFASRLLQVWRQQPETFMFKIDSGNVQDGGDFVNNG